MGRLIISGFSLTPSMHLPAKQSPTLGKTPLVFLLTVLIMVGGMLVWNAIDRHHDFTRNQRKLAQASVIGAANEIQGLIQGLHRVALLFAEREAAVLETVAKQPDDPDALERLHNRTLRYFPHAANVILADPQGRTVAEAHRGNVGEGCAADIQKFAINPHAPEVFIHPRPGFFHFDIMAPFDQAGPDPLVLSFSFPPDLVAQLLANGQLYRHELLLLRRDRSDLIEITAQGSRDKANRGFSLSKSERSRIAYRIPVQGTRWDLVDLPYPKVAAQHFESIALESASVLLIFFLISFIAFALLRRADRKILEHTQQLSMTNAQLHYLSLHDPLTGLANRTLLSERLEQAVRTCQRSGGMFALMLMDLDRFKDINDTLGHSMGDQLLRLVGERLKELLRESDTIARMGGDEFAVVVRVDGLEHTSLVASKLLDEFAEPFTSGDSLLSVGASIGIALFPLHARDAEGLIQRADVAMFRAKQSGTGFAIYEEQYDPNSMDRLALIGRLRDAIAQDELALRYQPKVAAKGGVFKGVEALVRWCHPQYGLLQPAAFLHLAEQSGAIKALTRWVLEHALADCVRFRSLGLSVPYAVNLSVRLLDDEGLPGEVAALLAAKGIPPDQLQLEITESAAMTDSVRGLRILKRLDALGMRLSIDDFGVGYSSLTYLKRLPVDELKIDKTFVLGMVQDESDAAIVRSTIELAHNLGLEVVAEGVESRETLDLLAAMNCDTVQGYFISQPLTADQFVEWMGKLDKGIVGGQYAHSPRSLGGPLGN